MQQPAQPGIPRFWSRQNYDFQPVGVERKAIQYHLQFPKTRRRMEAID
jgi:hypothetical protein